MSLGEGGAPRWEPNWDVHHPEAVDDLCEDYADGGLDTYEFVRRAHLVVAERALAPADPEEPETFGGPWDSCPDCGGLGGVHGCRSCNPKPEAISEEPEAQEVGPHPCTAWQATARRYCTLEKGHEGPHVLSPADPEKGDPWLHEYYNKGHTSPVQSEPVGWQARKTKSHQGWFDCSTPYAHKVYERDPDYEVRPLFTHPSEGEAVAISRALEDSTAMLRALPSEAWAKFAGAIDAQIDANLAALRAHPSESEE